MSSQISGVYTAVVTPFDKSGNIDWESFEKLLQHQKDGGIDGLVISGTTGESPTLTVQEKLALIRKARAFLPDNIKVMAGTGNNNTQASVELSKLAVDAGADSLLVVTPPYNKPSPSGLKLHFDTIADAVKHPICLYHVPARTGQLLNAQLLAELCRNKHIVAVKEASADLGLFSRAELDSDAAYLSGDDASFLPSLAVGGNGVISVVTNVFPKAFKELHYAFRSGNTERATAIHRAILPIIDAMFCESNPSPAKAALAHMGLCQNYLRAPLAPVSEDSFNSIVETLNNSESIFEDLGIK